MSLLKFMEEIELWCGLREQTLVHQKTSVSFSLQVNHRAVYLQRKHAVLVLTGDEVFFSPHAHPLFFINKS